jgi:hypothetical protein
MENQQPELPALLYADLGPTVQELHMGHSAALRSYFSTTIIL